MSGLREVLADHFVMWHETPHRNGAPLTWTTTSPRGEWRCQCGLKFGFSYSALDHQAAAVEAIAARHAAAAIEAVFASFRVLADEWVAAEMDADEYGPRAAHDGRDCAEMLRYRIRDLT